MYVHAFFGSMLGYHFPVIAFKIYCKTLRIKADKSK
jgi:hypothetical protein